MSSFRNEDFGGGAEAEDPGHGHLLCNCRLLEKSGLLESPSRSQPGLTAWGCTSQSNLFPQFTSLAPASSTEKRSQTSCLEKKAPPETRGYDFPAEDIPLCSHVCQRASLGGGSVCLCIYTWRPEVSVGWPQLLLLFLFFEAGPHTEPASHWFG